MTQKPYRCRIVVAGAGPVGLLFAWRLLRERRGEAFRVTVVDSLQPVRWRSETTDVRVYALSRESQLLLGELWPVMVGCRVSPYRRMRVFEGDDPAGPGTIRFDAADVGEPDLGHIVEDSLLRTVLLDRLSDLGVELDHGRGIETLARERGCTIVGLSDGTRLETDLVVGADGVESRVRSAAGIAPVRKAYRQRAIVSHVTTSRPHDETAWQRFLPGGPLAFLPLADGRSSIVWTNSDDLAEQLLALDDAHFAARLERASAGMLGSIVACTERRDFPLSLQHATSYVRPGMALIGDAAHVVHPLAGQGMNLGLADAAVLAETLAAASARGEYPADEFVLARYEREQKAHNLAMQLAFDALNELFRRDSLAWTAPLRQFGAALLNRAGPARRLLIRRAMGLDRSPPPADRS